MNKKRLFIAISLPEEIRHQLASISSYFHHPAVRWTPEQNLHITLHFIGSTPAENIRGRAGRISEIAKSHESFELKSDSLRVIRKRGKPVMIWSSFEKSEGFEQLVIALQKSLPGDAGKIPLPHVTLARVKEGIKELPELPPMKKFSLEVKEIELMESELGSGVPVYRMVEKFGLV